LTSIAGEVRSKVKRALEGAFHRQAEDRANKPIVLFDKGDRMAVAIARIDGPIEQVAAVENVVDGDPHGHSKHILVLDVEAGDPRQIERGEDFGSPARISSCYI
jgi:hypothetical protein